ncbi:MAG: tetratricopeptide repeat protein, partial [Candidatus Helarchaeota archaeon]
MSYQEAYTEYKSGNYQDAMESFLFYLKKFPNDPDAHFYIGICYMRLKDFKNAVLHFRKVVELIPKDKQAWKCMVKIYNEDLKDTKRAGQCENFILPKIPFDGYDITKLEKKEELIEKKTDEIKLPLVIADSTLLAKLFEIKKDFIIFLFRQASEFFNFVITDHKRDEFIEKTNFDRKEIFAKITIESPRPSDIYEFEKKILAQYPSTRKLKELHKDSKSWYANLSLAYTFLKQNIKKIILVTDDDLLKQIFQDLNLTCIYMNSDKFWVYLRYKLRRKFNPIFYM